MTVWILLGLTLVTAICFGLYYTNPVLKDNGLVKQGHGFLPVLILVDIVYFFHSDLANNFDWILVSLTLISGVLWLVDKVLWKKTRQQHDIKESVAIEYARGFFPVFLAVLIVRAFIISPSVVPSGSLLPTLKVGDYVLANNFAYGVKLPLTDKTLIHVGKPQRGDIALVHWPVNPQAIFIKRVIGVPGDVISYQNKVLTINGKVATQKVLGNERVFDGSQWLSVQKRSENLLGTQHNIYVRLAAPSQNFSHLVIPKGEYLLMGDNRDDSDDGRGWGLVPEKAFVGRAWRRFFSWDSTTDSVRWNRIGTKVH